MTFDLPGLQFGSVSRALVDWHRYLVGSIDEQNIDRCLKQLTGQ